MNDSNYTDESNSTRTITIDEGLARRVEQAVGASEFYDSPEDVFRDALEDRLSSAAVSTTGPSPEISRSRDRLEHAPGETVTETVELPSVLWERVVLEKPADVPIDKYIEHLVGLALLEIDAEHLDKTVQTDVHLESEQWERLRLKILAAMQAKDQDAETAFWNNVYEHIQTLPNLVVDGEVIGPQDVTPDVE